MFFFLEEVLGKKKKKNPKNYIGSPFVLARDISLIQEVLFFPLYIFLSIQCSKKLRPCNILQREYIVYF